MSVLQLLLHIMHIYVLFSNFNTRADIRLRQWANKDLPSLSVQVSWVLSVVLAGGVLVIFVVGE